MNLPSPIHEYFDADSRRDGDALIHTFAQDAVVKDEGASHMGREAIRAWWSAAKTKYQHAMEPLELAEQGDVMRVRTQVSGQFSGSPVTLTFAFRLEGDQISGLEILG